MFERRTLEVSALELSGSIWEWLIVGAVVFGLGWFCGGCATTREWYTREWADDHCTPVCAARLSLPPAQVLALPSDSGACSCAPLLDK